MPTPNALETIGTILAEEGHRDAIHVATLCVEAKVKLNPGQDCGITGTTDNPVGIVDPFLKHPVEVGQKFWLCIYPRTVTSLRHVWGHPKIPHDGVGRVTLDQVQDDEAKMSEEWIKNYADRIGVGYHILMTGADDKIRYDDYLVQGGTLEGVSTDPEFWKHYEIVRGVTVDEDKKENFFSCSC